MKMKTMLTLAAAAAVLMPAAVFAEGDDYFAPYAQARIWAGVVDQSKEVTGTENADLDNKMINGAARLGLKGKKGNLEGVAELGFGTQAGKDSNKIPYTLVQTRKIYGIYNYSDKISFLFGQDEAPYTFYSNSSVEDSTFSGFGSTSQDRDVQIKFSAYGAYIDLLNPTTSALPKANATTIESKNIDVLFPKIAAGYDYTLKDDKMNILIGVGGAGQVLKVDSLGADADTDLDTFDGEKITSALGYAHAKVKYDAFSVLANFGYAVNGGNMGLSYSKSVSAANTSAATELASKFSTSAVSTADGFENTTSMEGFIDLGYDFGIVELRGGAGYAQAKNKEWDKTDAQAAYYGQLSFPLVPKKLFLKPEVCYRDYMKDSAGEKQGHEWLAGVYVQANIE
ncbi:MAG: hypothetical protein ACRCUT_04505 [Spirochaetota bacterium]